MGLLAALAGLALGAVSLGFGFAGWPVDRLWLYLLGSAMLVLVGVQLMISWVVMRVLEGLSQREMLVAADLNGHPAERVHTANGGVGMRITADRGAQRCGEGRPQRVAPTCGAGELPP